MSAGSVENPPPPENTAQQTVRAQYNAFKDYLDVQLPKGPDKDRAVASLAISFEASLSAAAEVT